MGLKISKGCSRMCLFFGGPRQILEGYTDVDMIDDLDSMRSILGFLYTFVGELCLGNQNFLLSTTR